MNLKKTLIFFLTFTISHHCYSMSRLQQALKQTMVTLASPQAKKFIPRAAGIGLAFCGTYALLQHNNIPSNVHKKFQHHFEQHKEKQIAHQFFAAGCNGDIKGLTKFLNENAVFLQQKGLRPRMLGIGLLGAVIEKKTNVVEFLLKAGAYPNVVDEDGNTPLHHAFAQRDEITIKLLLKYNANSNIQNKDEKLPHELAPQEA